jgi:hypothetical protein
MLEKITLAQEEFFKALQGIQEAVVFQGLHTYKKAGKQNESKD